MSFKSIIFHFSDIDALTCQSFSISVEADPYNFCILAYRKQMFQVLAFVHIPGLNLCHFESLKIEGSQYLVIILGEAVGLDAEDHDPSRGDRLDVVAQCVYLHFDGEQLSYFGCVG